MIGWLIIAVAILAVAGVLRWSMKGGGLGGYSAADRSAIKRAQMDMSVDERHEKRVRMRRRWLPH
ncbi:hypothetical protein [Nocardioides panaciterrulae]|uniref:Uncharacterized protein n=1 Tax=Nocardioides panaciterrulae TaxID=661492 RepID=A0A7Y9E435_9ACTN|nr:hypothetical protein [Nocardioides panaciterrulae]NYD40607.1 hypothetical protein [Nocardioides panaciterrulae]